MNKNKTKILIASSKHKITILTNFRYLTNQYYSSQFMMTISTSNKYLNQISLRVHGLPIDDEML